MTHEQWRSEAIALMGQILWWDKRKREAELVEFGVRVKDGFKRIFEENSRIVKVVREFGK